MARRQILSSADLDRTFSGDLGQLFRPSLLTEDLAKLLGLKVKTIRVWIAAGRLDGCFRKRGKHNLIWRDKALDRIFNGPEWEHESNQ